MCLDLDAFEILHVDLDVFNDLLLLLLLLNILLLLPCLSWFGSVVHMDSKFAVPVITGKVEGLLVMDLGAF